MKKGMFAVICGMILALAAGGAFAYPGEEVHKEFDGIKAIDISTVSGDCIVRTHNSNEVVVDLYYDTDPEDALSYKMDERRGKLVIKERWHGRSTSGEVVWTLTVPKGTEIEFSTASGDLSVEGAVGDVQASTASGEIELIDVGGEIELSTASGDVTIVNGGGDCDVSTASGDIEASGVEGDLELSTASGEIEVRDCKGEFDLSTASGEIKMTDCSGTFEMGCASGEITATGVTIEGASSFSTASGDVSVVLARSCQYDLELSAASGDISLDYNGNDVEGYFEFEARKRGGSIRCPFDFDDEEEYEEDGRTYVRKSFSRKGKSPEIYMTTSSGRVELKK